LNNNYDSSVDYFAVLGIHFGACEKTVKMMYRKMARRYHPDVSTIHDAQKKFQEIADAYDVLKKYREAYCRDYKRYQTSKKSTSNQTSTTHSYNQPKRSHSTTSSANSEESNHSSRAYRKLKPIDGKDRLITYPLTLRYAIRLLKLGSFYIPGLKVKMKFTREAFMGKTFKLEGKGYSGLFGGKSGDYLVRFNIKVDTLKYRLEEGDIYGTFTLPKSLYRPKKALKIECPSGCLNITVPNNYDSDEYIKVNDMGLPADKKHKAGDFYARLIYS